MSRIAVLDRFSIGFYAVFAALFGSSGIGELVPVFATFALADERFHLALVALVVPTSVIALCLGCRLHKSRRILICGFAGVFVLVVAAILGGQHLGEIGETVLTVLGASVVALAHWFNFRACRACDCDIIEVLANRKITLIWCVALSRRALLLRC